VTLENAIKTAIELETKIRDIYVESLNKSSEKVARRVFSALAKEEQRHIFYLNDKLKELATTGSVTHQNIETIFPSISEINEEVDKLETKMSKKDFGVEIEMLRKALDVEIETSDFYRKMIDDLPAEWGKLFQPFLEIEEGHRAIVQAEIDFLTGGGFWFDFQETGMESGL
jgi:rubrerythrin